MLLAIYCDKLCCKTNGLLAFLQVELLKIGYKPYVPELNKLTNVTCTKNGNTFFDADITYDQDKQINRIVLNMGGNQYTDNL